ncbi:MAG TPA: hypothetical protein V6D50_10970 [Chroococcales cyanobacterium]
MYCLDRANRADRREGAERLELNVYSPEKSDRILSPSPLRMNH